MLKTTLLTLAAGLLTFAADRPAPIEGDWIAKNFKFNSGETLPELRLHYTTIGEPSGQVS